MAAMRHLWNAMISNAMNIGAHMAPASRAPNGVMEKRTAGIIQMSTSSIVPTTQVFSIEKFVVNARELLNNF